MIIFRIYMCMIILIMGKKSYISNCLSGLVGEFLVM